MSRLTAQDLTVRRGGRTILDRVSLDIEGGRFVAVIGANGAGKSTLLAALAGLLRPDAGAAALDGRPLAQWRGPELARRRAYLPQSPRCEWPISVERLVALGLTPALPAIGALPADLSAAVDRALAACDLTDRADQPATTLSGGELARAMLARALVGDPDVLIVDEPTTGLDPRHALDAMVRLKALAAGGKLVVAALHDLTLAARYADRIVALEGGRLVADGPVGEVLTPDLLKAVFGVEAQIVATAQGMLVDMAAPT